MSTHSIALTSEERLLTSKKVNASIFRICQRSAFFAALALHARIEITRELPTAATDGRSIFVNPDFIEPLTLTQQDGLILHEVLHAALQHVVRRGTRHPRVWNIAADIVVNGMIRATGEYDLPEGGVENPGLQHLSVEEVYEKLIDRSDQEELQLTIVDLVDGPPSDAGGAGEGASQPNKSASESEWRAALEQASQISQAAGQGHLPANMKREIAAITQAVVDWKSHLWRYMVQTPTDFGEYDKRFIGDGLYLETLQSENVRVAICVDTSGSIDLSSLTALITEVRAIAESYPHLRCDLYYADTKVVGPFALTADSELPAPVGGGGTDFRPFFKELDENSDPWKPTVAVYLTDGWGDFPETPSSIPTLWAIIPGGRDAEQFPFGETIRLLPHS